MTPKQPLTAERAREVLNYDPETGDFTWLVASRGTYKGALAGYKRPDGYVAIMIDRKLYFAHRLNLQNRRQPNSNNKSGHLGVSWHSGNESFTSQISIQGKIRHLGYFRDPAEAHQAYLVAKRQHHAGNTL